MGYFDLLCREKIAYAMKNGHSLGEVGKTPLVDGLLIRLQVTVVRWFTVLPGCRAIF